MNYNKYINSMEEINYLRKDLMETKSTDKTTSDIMKDDVPDKLKQLITQEIKRIINEKKDKYLKRIFVDY